MPADGARQEACGLARGHDLKPAASAFTGHWARPSHNHLPHPRTPHWVAEGTELKGVSNGPQVAQLGGSRTD